MATRPISLQEIRALAGITRQGPATVEERKMLAAANRQLKIAGGPPSLAEMRARRVAQVAGQGETRMAPPGGVTRPVFIPEQTAFVVPNEPLDRRRLGAQRKLGLQPAGVMRGDEINAKALVPATYRPLAGLAPNQRGQTIAVDSTLFNAAITNANPYGYFPNTPIVQAKSPGDDAEMLTVCLGFQLSKPLVAGALANFDTRVKAEITWGIGGAEYKAQCDWLNGTIFSMPANYLRVVAIVPDNASNAGNDAPLFLLSAGIGYGPPPASNNRARLTVAASGALGVAVDVAIPDFANGYNLIGASGSGPYLISQRDSGASGLVLYEHIYTGFSNAYEQNTNALPIGNGADIITLTNLAPGGTQANMFFVFNLTF